MKNNMEDLIVGRLNRIENDLIEIKSLISDLVEYKDFLIDLNNQKPQIYKYIESKYSDD